jgi:hypothetical protein
VLVKRYQRKPAVVEALQASLLQGELGVLLYIAALILVLAFSFISRRRTRCEATDFLTNSIVVRYKL